MKIPPRALDAFVKKPDPAVRAVLIYGPDHGLMQERAALIGRTVVADLNDPFNVAVLSAGILKDDPARLRDEASAISMMGGNRLIRVEDAGDALTTLLKDYLSGPAEGCLIVLQADDLGARSSLRKLFETAPNAAAIPCYVADAGDVQTLIRQGIQQAGYAIDPDACAWLGQQLTGDRLMARGEIDKLTLYMADRPGGATVTLEDAQACCGQGGTRSLDDLVYAAGGGNPDLAMRAFRQLVDEGTPVITIHRTLQNHFRRLHYTLSLMAEGLPMGEAVKSLNPRIFFKWEESFRDQLNRWSMGSIDVTLSRLARLEADCKQTGAPVETLTAQAILSLSAKR
jgi:DNA polymerase-3 subunit delta